MVHSLPLPTLFSNMHACIHTCATDKDRMILYLCVCMFMCCVCICDVCLRVYPMLVLIEIRRGCHPPFPCWYRVSHWIWSSPFWLRWPTVELLRSALPLMSGFGHAQPFLAITSVQEIGIHIFLISQWALYPLNCLFGPRITVLSVGGRTVLCTSVWSSQCLFVILLFSCPCVYICVKVQVQICVCTCRGQKDHPPVSLLWDTIPQP